MKTTLIFDMNYILYRNRSLVLTDIKSEYFDDETMISLYDRYKNEEPLSTSESEKLKQYLSTRVSNFAIHRTLQEIISFQKTFKSHKIVCCFDSKFPWRKDIATVYKQDRAKKRKEEFFDYSIFYKTIDEFADFLNKHSKFLTLKVDPLEADDLIYLYCKTQEPTVQKIVITADKDLIQILRFKNVKLYNILKKEFRRIPDDLKLGKTQFNTLKEWIFVNILNGKKNNAGKVFEGKRIGPVTAKKLYKPHTKFEELNNMFKAIPGSKDRFMINAQLVDFELIPKKYIKVFGDHLHERFIQQKDYQFHNILKFLQDHNLRNIMDNFDEFMKDITE